jgi:hypothetical protein
MSLRYIEPEVDEIDYLIFGGKVCYVCGHKRPKSTEYFAVDNSERDRLTGDCKRCRSIAGIGERLAVAS